MPFSCSHPHTDQRSPTTHHQQPCSTPPPGPCTRVMRSGIRRRGHSVNQVQLRQKRTKPLDTKQSHITVKSRGWYGKLRWPQVAEPLCQPVPPNYPFTLQHLLVMSDAGLRSKNRCTEHCREPGHCHTICPQPCTAPPPVANADLTPCPGMVVVAEQA